MSAGIVPTRVYEIGERVIVTLVDGRAFAVMVERRIEMLGGDLCPMWVALSDGRFVLLRVRAADPKGKDNADGGTHG